jgi:restriction endonuclease Mrr
MMTTDAIEDLFVAECRRQGHQPGQNVMREAGITLAGSSLTAQGLVSLPSKGVISLSDLVRSLHSQMPESFSEISADKPGTQQAGNLTEAMRLEVAETRQARRLPDDWKQARDKYATNTLTAKMMAERERNWK